jgi:hypothetical protein
MGDKKKIAKAAPKASPRKTLKPVKKLGENKLMYNPFQY